MTNDASEIENAQSADRSGWRRWLERITDNDLAWIAKHAGGWGHDEAVAELERRATAPSSAVDGPKQ